MESVQFAERNGREKGRKCRMRGEDQKWFASWEDAMKWINERKAVGIVFHSWSVVGGGIVVKMIDRRTGE